MPCVPEQFCLGLGFFVILGDAGHNIRKIAGSFRWNDNGFRGGCFVGEGHSFCCEHDPRLFLNGCDNGMIESGDAVVVEL